MTRADLLAAIGYELNKNSTLDTPTANRLKNYLNQRHRRILSMPGLQHLRDTTLTFASVASQTLYGLPGVAKVNRIWDPSNSRTLVEMSIGDYRRLDPRATLETGIPEAFVWFGYGAVAKQPSDASEIFAKSSSASDTQNAYLGFAITGNYDNALTKQLNGVTAVSFSATVTTIVDINKFYLATAAAGVVTLHEDSGIGTELARIGIGQTKQRYYQFYLWRTPGDAITYSADVTREIPDLAQDSDEPWLPQDFHDLLVMGAVTDELRHTDDSRYAVMAGELSRREKQFAYWMHESASGSTRMLEEPSRLGAWFPSGS